jgi:hypothetical protein
MARQSVYELVFRRTTRIERLLTERGGEGAGLMGKAERIRYRLPGYLWRDLEWISAERNRVAHQEHAYLADRDEFERCAKRVIAAIEAIPLNHDRNFMGFVRRSFSNSRRRRRAQPRAKVQVVFAVIIGIVALTIISNHRETRRKFDEEFEERRRAFDERFNGRAATASLGGTSSAGPPALVPSQKAAIKKRKATTSQPKKQLAASIPTGDPTGTETEGAPKEPVPSDDRAEVDAGTPNPAGTIKMTSQGLDSF